MADNGVEHLDFDFAYAVDTASQRRFMRAERYLSDLLSENQWLLPLAGSVVGVLLALWLSNVGENPDPDMWAITVGGVRSGLLGALSILFAGLSIVLALASSTIQEVVGRYSLRILRIYLRNPWDKAVIAVFAMAATFILVMWFQLRALPPDALAPIGGVLIGALLLFFSGLMMIWYIGALLSWFRLDHTLDRVTKLILNAAHSVEHDHLEDSPVGEQAFDRPTGAITLRAHTSGYLMDVDAQGLLDLALGHDVNFVIGYSIGRSVVRGEAIGWISVCQTAAGDLPSAKDVEEMIGISDVRELKNAVGYGIVVLVDIAIMALSPGINDPNTAVQVIESLAFLFPQLALARLGSFGRTDSEGQQRVAVRAAALGDYIEMATTQIVMYSNEDPAVVLALQRLVRILEGLDLSESDRQVVNALSAKLAENGNSPVAKYTAA